MNLTIDSKKTGRGARTKAAKLGQGSLPVRFYHQPASFTLYGASIPPDLLEAFLGPGKSAKRITGNWRIANDQIVFSNVRADGERTEGSEIKLGTMHTGVIRITTDAAQYVMNRAAR